MCFTYIYIIFILTQKNWPQQLNWINCSKSTYRQPGSLLQWHDMRSKTPELSPCFARDTHTDVSKSIILQGFVIRQVLLLMGSEKKLLVLRGVGKSGLKTQSQILILALILQGAFTLWVMLSRGRRKRREVKTRYWTLSWMSLLLADTPGSQWLSERLPLTLDSKLTACLKGNKLSFT